MTTRSPLLPTSAAVCPPSRPSPTAGEAINARGECRRCSYLLLSGLLMERRHEEEEEGDEEEGKAEEASDQASSKKEEHRRQQRRRHSPPFSMSTSPFLRLLPSFFASASGGSGQHSRGESSLELEALTAVHQFAIAVQSIAVSEMLPRTPDLIFVNLTTLDGQPYCLELTAKGWRVTSLRTDCMQGDFTRMDMFTRYYDTLHELMDVHSPGYRERFAEDFGRRFQSSNGSKASQHAYRHSNDCSSGPMSDCSEEQEDCMANGNASPCAFCRKRPTEMEEELENNPRGGNGGEEALQRPEEEDGEELEGQKHWQRWQQQQLNE